MKHRFQGKNYQHSKLESLVGGLILLRKSSYTAVIIATMIETIRSQATNINTVRLAIVAAKTAAANRRGRRREIMLRIILIPAVCQTRSACGWNRCMKWRFGSQVSAARCQVQVFSIRSGFGIIPAPAPEPENLNLIPDRWDPGPENVSPHLTLRSPVSL